MGNIKIVGNTYIHTKNAIDEVSFLGTPTGERMFIRDTWVLKENTEGGYDLYLRKKGTDTYTTHFMTRPSDSMMVELIQSGSIHKDMTTHHQVAKEVNVDKWSIRYDGQSIMGLALEKPKMPLADLINIIVNEGGSVDAKGIVHRG